MIPEYEISIRLLIAAGLGAVIGIERERQGQPAGLRTIIILVVGCALAMTLSINLAGLFNPSAPTGDPARLAAQVVSGIGFLGAGAILRYGTNIKGLTTATSLWTMAVVGLTVGAGYYLSSVIATIILLVVLVLLNVIEHRFIRPLQVIAISIKADDRPGLVVEIQHLLSLKSRHIDTFSIHKNIEDRHLALETTIRSNDPHTVDQLVDELSKIEGVRSFKLD